MLRTGERNTSLRARHGNGSPFLFLSPRLVVVVLVLVQLRGCQGKWCEWCAPASRRARVLRSPGGTSYFSRAPLRRPPRRLASRRRVRLADSSRYVLLDSGDEEVCPRALGCRRSGPGGVDKLEKYANRSTATAPLANEIGHRQGRCHREPPSRIDIASATRRSFSHFLPRATRIHLIARPPPAPASVSLSLCSHAVLPLCTLPPCSRI